MAGNEAPGEKSAAVRAAVEAARGIQRERFDAQPGIYSNAHMTPRDVRRHCRLEPPAEGRLRHAIAKLGFSARPYTRVLKLARTIADLAGAPEIDPVHGREAIQYRLLDRVRGPARAR